jgi:hypothetical protein
VARTPSAEANSHKPSRVDDERDPPITHDRGALPPRPTSALASIPQTYPELLNAVRRGLIDRQREIDREGDRG